MSDVIKQCGPLLTSLTGRLKMHIHNDVDLMEFKSGVAILISNNPKLLQCNQESMQTAIVQAAASGLMPGGGDCYIAAYKGSARFGITKNGLLKLAYNTGIYKQIHSGIIKSDMERGKDWDCKSGTGNSYYLWVDPVVEQEATGNPLFFYAYYNRIDGASSYILWTTEKCLAHGEKYSPFYHGTNSMWKKEPDAMCAKTVLRELLTKHASKSKTMQIISENPENYKDNKDNKDNKDEYEKCIDVMKRINVNGLTGDDMSYFSDVYYAQENGMLLDYKEAYKKLTIMQKKSPKPQKE